ncbi:MAG: multicopper oxidase domain-containing protein [Proteiniphilum sp.]|nr:multicopper oxidase domain-containing protein [Proteiniphilum sp.]
MRRKKQCQQTLVNIFTSVKIALRFEDFTGIFLYHCHNLKHKDMDMIRNYEVVE